MTFKLTKLVHGGGCGCKIAADTLSEILQEYFAESQYSDHFLRNDAMDDAAVFRLNERQALVATTDFFTPIVDDARDFGRIAAANALSDIYAMGARPLFALNVMGFPVAEIPRQVAAQILAGGADVCRDAGIMVAGGHSIDMPEPVYGLAAVGIAPVSQLKRNADAVTGDALILSKPLGIGILASALRQDRLSDDQYRELIYWTTRLNRIGEQLGALPSVHALTDVTGFGLLGHLSEICAASKVSAVIDCNRVPIIKAAQQFVEQGLVTKAMQHNSASYCESVHFHKSATAAQRNLLADAQTNGGLLVTCAATSARAIITMFRREGFYMTQQIGAVEAQRQHQVMVRIQC